MSPNVSSRDSRVNKTGRVALGIAPQSSHRSGRAQLKHPVRPVKDSLSRFAIRRRYVDPLPGFEAPDGLPSYGSLTDIPLPSPGSPRSRFPCFIGTMEMCDSLRLFRCASFPSRGDTMRCVCRFAPVGPNAKPQARGASSGPRVRKERMETFRVSQVPEESAVPMPCSPTHPGFTWRNACPLWICC